MTLRIAIQMDDPAGFNPRGDSTIVLGLEAQARGHSLVYYRPGDLQCLNGLISADVRPIRFFDDTARWFEAGDVQYAELEKFDVVLMRQDPPYDMAYLTATYLLERLKGKVLVANDPAAVRDLPEKLSVLQFPDFTPPTLISRSAEAIHDFRAGQGEIVIKPLYGFGGQEVYLFKTQDANLSALLEHYFAISPEPLIAQRFLPQVESEDRRVILMDGEVAGLMGRIPPSGEIRANLRAGGHAEKTSLNARQQHICATVGAWLKERGILFAGLDLIGDYLTEINITSPTGLRAVMALEGRNPAVAFWDAVEGKL